MNVISFWVLTMLARAFFFMGLVGTLTVFGLTYVFGAEMRTIAGLFCTTQEQITEVFTRINAKENPQTIFTEVNGRGDPTACAVIRNMAFVMTDFTLADTAKVGEQVFYFYSGRVIGVKTLDGTVHEATGVIQFFILTEPLIAAHKVRSISYTLIQHRHHPEKDMPMHRQFYSNWMRPDNPKLSCCSDYDCYAPAQVKYEDGHWWFIRREDAKWVKVPPDKIERERDSPDGGSHVCAAAPSNYAPDTVFCFVIGIGG